MLSKTGSFAVFNTATPNCVSSRCVLDSFPLSYGLKQTHKTTNKQKPGSLKKILDETVQIINLSKSQPWSTLLLTILRGKVASKFKVLLQWKPQCLVGGKALLWSCGVN